MASATPTTPKSQSLAPEMPVSHPTSQKHFLTRERVNEGRQAVLPNLRRYLQVPYAALVSSVLGPPPEISLIPDALTEGLLSAVRSIPPSKSNLEDGALKPLGDLISSIFEKIPSCSFFFIARPSETPLEDRTDMSLPDACVARPSTNPNNNKTHWFDIAIPLEFKIENSNMDKYDNEQKMIWSLHKIMCEDPLRRFAFGITIEDTDMTVWCTNRAFVAASVPINFIEEIDKVISLFYSIGRKTIEGLGWDPTVERVWKNNSQEIQYRFTINNKSYITKRELATYGADAMVGRGTRVYEATDEESRETVAIKDSWRDEDRQSEGAILAQILRDIRNKLGEEKETDAQKYFVRIHACEDVVISGRTDKTFTPETTPGVKWIPISSTPPISTSLHDPGVGLVPGTDAIRLSAVQRVRRKPDEFPRRIHVRTVFEDVGTPLYNIHRLADCFLCLSDSQMALSYMHRAGWVHRDYSVANVLWVKQEDRTIGKLTDFEYAKKVDSGISHEVRTGTLHFMAVEVELQGYLFQPQKFDRSLKHGEPSKQLPFRMNYLHDLESQWWAAMWILLYYTDRDSPAKDTDAQLRWLDDVFPSSLGSALRLTFFKNGLVREMACWTLSDTYRSRCLPVFELADTLRGFYQRAEESFLKVELDEQLVNDVHKEVSEAYEETNRELAGSNISLQPLRTTIGQKKSNSDDSPTELVAKRVRE